MSRWSATLSLQLDTFSVDVSISGDEHPIAVIGPNGSGKSTLLRALAGLHRLSAGRIEIEGACIFDSTAQINIPPEERQIGYVPQGYALFPHLSARENVAFGLMGSTSRLSKKDASDKAHGFLHDMGCARLSDRRVSHLSGGAKQRIALARALVTQPRMLLLDEPLAALDITARQSTRAFLTEFLNEHRIPTLMTTHDPQDVNALQSTVYVLDQGRLVANGRPRDLVREAPTPFVEAFFAHLSE